MELREYQNRISDDAVSILQRKGVVYLSMEVRTGKSLTALETAKKYGAKNVLFITKIKAFSSVQTDYDNFGYKFQITIINKESLSKVKGSFDFIIVDEAHQFAAYPKPGKYQKEIKQRFSKLPMILMSGTPTPESHSQWYHQFQLSENSPFKEYSNFYKWSNDFVNVKLKYLGYAQVKDYSDGIREKIIGRIRHYVITFTQKEAGFTSTINEMVLFCNMKPITYQLADKLKKDLVLKSKTGQTIIADTAVKLQQKVHQIYSGTVKFEDGSYRVIDDTKACFIKHSFKGKKIGIFYKFKAELEMLNFVFGDLLTTDLSEFDNSNKSIALQFISGREGLSLRNADHIVFMNIDFSAVSYWQSRDRMTTIQRKENTVFWVFAKGGIEEKIYKTVLQKKDYTSKLFLKDYGIKFPNKSKEGFSRAGV